jgi:hypothetical protein
VETGAEVVDIMSLLKRSVERAGKAREAAGEGEAAEESGAAESKASKRGRKSRKTA